MERFIPRVTLTIGSLLLAAVANADISETTVFPIPAQYCFEQTTLRGDFTKITLDHNMIIPEEDRFKNGTVFVAARFKSKPDIYLLRGDGFWVKINQSSDANQATYQSYSSLQPVIRLTTFFRPMDVSGMLGDGEIWVGYGLRSSPTGNSQEAFEDMVLNHRFKLLWEAGVPAPGLPGKYYAPGWGLHDDHEEKICLTTTSMKVSIPTAEAAAATPGS